MFIIFPSQQWLGSFAGFQLSTAKPLQLPLGATQGKFFD